MAGDMAGEVAAFAVPAAVRLRFLRQPGALAVERRACDPDRVAAGTRRRRSCARFSGPPVRRTAVNGSGVATARTVGATAEGADAAWRLLFCSNAALTAAADGVMTIAATNDRRSIRKTLTGAVCLRRC